MVKGLEKARIAARKALESTYEGVCTVVEYDAVTDEQTKITHHEEIVVMEKQPCKLSFEKLATAVQTETVAAISQNIKLFLSPTIEIRSGSKIIVTQNNQTNEYAVSGQSAVYPTHQEILLELFREWT